MPTVATRAAQAGPAVGSDSISRSIRICRCFTLPWQTTVCGFAPNLVLIWKWNEHPDLNEAPKRLSLVAVACQPAARLGHIRRCFRWRGKCRFSAPSSRVSLPAPRSIARWVHARICACIGGLSTRIDAAADQLGSTEKRLWLRAYEFPPLLRAATSRGGAPVRATPGPKHTPVSGPWRSIF